MLREKAILADHFKRAQSDEEESQSSVNMSGLKYNSYPCLLECHQTGIWPQFYVRPPAVVMRSWVQILRYARLKNRRWQYFNVFFQTMWETFGRIDGERTDDYGNLYLFHQRLGQGSEVHWTASVFILPDQIHCKTTAMTCLKQFSWCQCLFSHFKCKIFEKWLIKLRK